MIRSAPSSRSGASSSRRPAAGHGRMRFRAAPASIAARSRRWRARVSSGASHTSARASSASSLTSGHGSPKTWWQNAIRCRNWSVSRVQRNSPSPSRRSPSSSAAPTRAGSGRRLARSASTIAPSRSTWRATTSPAQVDLVHGGQKVGAGQLRGVLVDRRRRPGSGRRCGRAARSATATASQGDAGERRSGGQLGGGATRHQVRARHAGRRAFAQSFRERQPDDEPGREVVGESAGRMWTVCDEAGGSPHARGGWPGRYRIAAGGSPRASGAVAGSATGSQPPPGGGQVVAADERVVGQQRDDLGRASRRRPVRPRRAGHGPAADGRRRPRSRGPVR